MSFNPLNYTICFDKPRRLTDVGSWHEHIPFAFSVIEMLKPKIFVELGTHRGDSYCTFCQAVDALGLDTACYAVDTWKGDEHSGLYGSEILEELRAYHDPLYGRFSRLIQSRFDQALDYFSDGSIDLLHIDGLHSYEAVKHDFETWLPKMSQRGVILFHDINVHEREFGVWKFWEEVTENYPCFEFKHGHGLGMLAVGTEVADEVLTFLNMGEQEVVATTRLYSYLGEKIALGHQLQFRDAQIAELNGTLHVRDAQIAELNGILQFRDAQIAELNGTLHVRDAQIAELTSALQACDSQIFSLENEIHLMQQSIVWRLTMKFHNIFVERILPHETKQRNMYDLALKGCRIITNEGTKSFWWHYKERGRVMKLEAMPKSDIKEIQDIDVDTNIKNWSGEKIIFPAPSENPEVSIIIPVHNNANYTFNCLDSLFKHTHESFEIIIVDDASDDKTPMMLKSMENINVIRNDENQGFVESCNRGAKLSRSEYLFFLNNDTIVTENWLEPLKKIILKDDVGAVGSKLVYPDGKLQEAGGIIWNDASGWNYGRYDDPNKPKYNFIREVDYCSGAALLVKKHIFEELGGFDERFKPGYYEDTDLCFSIREKGYKVLYQPKSIIIHFEGVTSGTDVNKGVKSYQEINKSKFYNKWRNVLGNEHYNPDSANLLFYARDKKKGNNILVIDHYIPTFDMDSGSYRMYNILRILSELGHKVTFVGDNPKQLEPYTGVFQQNGVEVIYAPFIPSIEDYLNRNGRFFDIVVLSRSHIAVNHVSAVKKYCTKAKVIFDTVDLQYLRETRRAAVEGDENILKNANEFKKMEFQLARQCDLTLVVSPIEKDIIFEEAPDLKVEILSNIHEIFLPIKCFSERKDIMFLGGFNHLPNIDAVKYFVKEILPTVMKEIPDIKFYVVGSNPPKEIRKLESDNIIVTGYVEDLTPHFENYRISVAPLRYGAGVKGKIGEAMAHGLPVVATSIGAEGLGLVDGDNILIADTSDEFAKKIVMLYDNEEMWGGLSDNSLIAIEKNYSFAATKTILKRLLNKINGNDSNVMRQDWNKRAKENFRYYIASFKFDQSENEFDGSGQINVNDFITKDLELITSDMDPNDMRILEIGCGAGRMSKYLGKIFGEVYGIDVSDEMIRIGMERLKSNGNIHLTANNGRDLSNFPDNFFDFVFSYIVFQHIPYKDAIINYLREVHRTLKSGKIFKFQINGYTGKEYSEAQKDTWLGESFSEKEIEQLCEKIGFAIVCMSGQGTQYFWVTARKLPSIKL